MNRVLLAAAAALLLAGPAFAGDEAMTNFYGNTLVATGGIAESHTHFKADHTFDVSATAMGMDYNFRGTWKLENGQLCRHYDDPVPPRTPNPLCAPFEPHKVGDSWTVTMNGNTRTLTLKAGIE
jgi:hypothetical protein